MLVFCFFKQKTAYEMRISDWSSDVCSSDRDLDRVDSRRRGAPLGLSLSKGRRSRGGQGNELEDECGAGRPRGYQEHDRGICRRAAEPGIAVCVRAADRQGHREIGRASCRKSVCQNVSIWVAAGVLKKKKKSN